MKLTLLACLLVMTACGRDDDEIDSLVGNRCDNDRQCEERCFIDGDKFPDGICSVTCTSDNDCPVGTYCVDENGGLCLFACPEFDCDRLGPAWECRDRSRFGGGNVNVCFGQ